jgi:predicted transposase YbfD/YdcC
LLKVIALAILGVICGADNWVDSERYGTGKQEGLGQCLDLSHGVPWHDTFGRVFRWLDAEAFQKRFIAWTERICEMSGGKSVAVEGKKLRRSQDRVHQRDGIWRVSAWVSENRLVLGQRKVDEKANEITAIPELLTALDITDGVVTIDAMGTQTASAQRIVEAQADYLRPVKENQGTLYQDMAMLFDGFEEENYVTVPHETYQQVSEGHDRREIRQCWVVSEPEYRA